jgi:membrane-bound acyltransferase YfiQ involved in biofilm formation
MSDTVEKNIHINFTARNLITNEVDKTTGAITGLNINLQRMPYFFNSAGYALNQLNEKLFGSNKAVQDLSNAFLLLGTAMRIVQIMQTMITTLEALTSPPKPME